jgi:hypothetical protein
MILQMPSKSVSTRTPHGVEKNMKLRGFFFGKSAEYFTRLPVARTPGEVGLAVEVESICQN